jgi:hypothetical protein
MYAVELQEQNTVSPILLPPGSVALASPLCQPLGKERCSPPVVALFSFEWERQLPPSRWGAPSLRAAPLPIKENPVHTAKLGGVVSAAPQTRSRAGLPARLPVKAPEGAIAGFGEPPPAPRLWRRSNVYGGSRLHEENGDFPVGPKNMSFAVPSGMSLSAASERMSEEISGLKPTASPACHMAYHLPRGVRMGAVLPVRFFWRRVFLRPC